MSKKNIIIFGSKFGSFERFSDFDGKPSILEKNFEKMTNGPKLVKNMTMARFVKICAIKFLGLSGDPRFKRVETPPQDVFNNWTFFDNISGQLNFGGFNAKDRDKDPFSVLTTAKLINPRF